MEFVKNRLAAKIFAKTTRYTVTKQDLEKLRYGLIDNLEFVKRIPS